VFGFAKKKKCWFFMQVRLQLSSRLPGGQYDSGVSESNVSEQKKRTDHKQAVRDMVEKIEKNLDTKKATLGHYVRLLQLERELETEHPSK